MSPNFSQMHPAPAEILSTTSCGDGITPLPGLIGLTLPDQEVEPTP